ncbi:zinc ribbon domain-containing protein, partial [Streptomyces sp. NPDC058066]|uniref:zinc ribbon domain-containing protein n=1 Tax=Streptomyces sp. NPDC058066 TaxID=3346323 RepID=UPI0036E00EF2
TSQTCAECGHVDKRNRVDQGLFICRGCGVVAQPTGMLPATSPHVALLCGLRGVSHASLPPHSGCLDGGANPAASRALPPSPVLQGRVKLTIGSSGL